MCVLFQSFHYKGIKAVVTSVPYRPVGIILGILMLVDIPDYLGNNYEHVE